MKKEVKILSCLLCVVLVLCSCENKIKIKTTDNYDFKYKKSLNEEKIFQFLECNEVSDGGYRYQANEIQGDIYSTYFNNLFLKNCNINIDKPSYNSENYNAIFDNNSIFDIYLLTEMYPSEILNDLKILNKVKNCLEICQNEIKIDNKQDITNTKFIIYHMLGIYKNLNLKYNKEEIYRWIKDNYKCNTSSSNDVIKEFDTLYSWLQIMNRCEYNCTYLEKKLSSIYNNYLDKLEIFISNDKIKICDLSNYVNYSNKYSSSRKISKKFAKKLLSDSYLNKDGTYNLTDAMGIEPQVKYYASEICKTYITEFDFIPLINQTLACKRADKMFTLSGENKSDIYETYYCYSILSLIEKQEPEKIKKYLNNNVDKKNTAVYYTLQQMAGVDLNYSEIITTLNQNCNAEDGSWVLQDILSCLKILKENNINISNDTINRIKSITKYYFSRLPKLKGDLREEYKLISICNYLQINQKDSKKLINNIRSNVDHYLDQKGNELSNTYFLLKIFDILGEEIPENLLKKSSIVLNGSCNNGLYAYGSGNSLINWESNYFAVYVNRYFTNYNFKSV